MRFHKGFVIGNESDDANHCQDENLYRLPSLIGGDNILTSVFGLGMCNRDMNKLATYKLDSMDRQLIKSTFLDYNAKYEKDLEEMRYNQRLAEI